MKKVRGPSRGPWKGFALFLLLTPGFASVAKGQSDSRALHCLHKFVERMSQIKKYKTVLTKVQVLPGKNPTSEKIQIRSDGPHLIEFEYLNQGETGIKNNGMKLQDQGSGVLHLEWGKPTFLGSVVQMAARAVHGNTLGLTDPVALDGEIFTLNRAGFRYLAAALGNHLPGMRAAKQGGAKAEGNTCNIKFVPTTPEYFTVELKPTDSIFDIEEKYGTLAYLLYSENKKLFSGFASLFDRKESVSVRIPKSLTRFDLRLDEESFLPREFTLYLADQPIAEYLFLETQVLE